MSARPAHAQTRLRFDDPALEITAPAGYQRLAENARAPDVLATLRRETLGQIAVLQMVRLDAELPEAGLDPAGRETLRRSDPVPFRDRSARVESLGVEVELLVGEATVQGQALVRYAVALPTRDEAVLLTLVVPAAARHEGLAALRTMAASARGPRAWLTPRERAIGWLRVLSGGLATALMLAYALGWLATRTRPGGVPGRRWLLGAVAAAWALCGVALALPWPARYGLAAVQALGLALVFAWRARRAALSAR